MKNNSIKYSTYSILIAFFLIFSNVSLIISNIYDSERNIVEKDKDIELISKLPNNIILKSPKAASGLIFEPFSIDTMGNGNFTWEEAVLEPWCSGNGSKINPYVLKDFAVNGSTTVTYTLLINNSVDYLRIENVTIFDIPISSGRCGLWLLNVSNCILKDLNIINTYQFGIKISDDSHRIEIRDSYFFQNWYGIRILESCSDFIIENNTFDQNSATCVELVNNAINITITKNTFQNCTSNGIGSQGGVQELIITQNTFYNMSFAVGFSSSRNSLVEDNIVQFCENGISISNSRNDLIQNNTLYNCTNFGIQIKNFALNSIIRNNIIDIGGAVGIYINYNAHYITIENNTISDCIDGIKLLRDCNNILITKNSIFNSSNYGIYLYDNCDSIIISDNNIILTTNHGIYIFDTCDNLDFLNNIIIKGTYTDGINGILVNSNGIGLNINDNYIRGYDMGIYITLMDQCEIKYNRIKHIDYGITLSSANYITIEGNMIYNATITAVRFFSSDYVFTISNWIENCTLGTTFSGVLDGIIYTKNIFLHNGQHAEINDVATMSVLGIGNYWDNYTGTDNNSDGIGDSPHLIQGTQGVYDDFVLWDEIAPSFTEKPEDLSLGYNDLDEEISWIIDDITCINPWYSIYIDDQKFIDHEVWTALEPISLNIVDLFKSSIDSVGTYEIKIIASDGYDMGFEYDLPAHFGGRVIDTITLEIEDIPIEGGSNYAPANPVNPSPIDSSTDIPTNPLLQIDVFDQDDDILMVSFMDADTDTLIGTDIINGSGTAMIHWFALEDDTDYQWYVMVQDGGNLTVSSNYSFHTISNSTNDSDGEGIYAWLQSLDLISLGLGAGGTVGIAGIIALLTVLGKKKKN